MIYFMAHTVYLYNQRILRSQFFAFFKTVEPINWIVFVDSRPKCLPVIAANVQMNPWSISWPIIGQFLAILRPDRFKIQQIYNLYRIIICLKNHLTFLDEARNIYTKESVEVFFKVRLPKLPSIALTVFGTKEFHYLTVLVTSTINCTFSFVYYDPIAQ